MDIVSGIDSEGKVSYDNIQQVWNDKELMTKWYQKAQDYWSAVTADVDGMLGGFAHVSNDDVKESTSFLNKLFQEQDVGRMRAIGIGRVCELLLLPLFNKVDLLEGNKKFIEVAEQRLSSKQNIGNFYGVPLQEFHKIVQGDGGISQKYDVIWVQWVASYLTDDDFVLFLNRCKSCLSPNGIVCFKENADLSKFVIDLSDCSVTRYDNTMMMVTSRTPAQFEELFKRAGYDMLRRTKQKKFPKGLFPVMMYATRPRAATEQVSN